MPRIDRPITFPADTKLAISVIPLVLESSSDVLPSEPTFLFPNNARPFWAESLCLGPYVKEPMSGPVKVTPHHHILISSVRFRSGQRPPLVSLGATDDTTVPTKLSTPRVWIQRRCRLRHSPLPPPAAHRHVLLYIRSRVHPSRYQHCVAKWLQHLLVFSFATRIARDVRGPSRRFAFVQPRRCGVWGFKEEDVKESEQRTVAER